MPDTRTFGPLTLHCFGESGHSYKVALMLRLCGLDWQPRFVDFFGGAARSPEFRALNPMGECPVLVEDRADGPNVLTQSGVILFDLARRTGRFGGSTPAAEAEVLRWILWDNHKFSGQIGTCRFLMNFVPPEKRPAEVIGFVQARMKAAYATLDAHLATRDWVADTGPTIADFSLCSYLYYPEPFGFDRADWPHIANWLDRIAALPDWAHPYDLMPGNPSERAPA